MTDSQKSELSRLARFVIDKRRFFASQGLTCAGATVLTLALAAIFADIEFGFPPAIRWALWGTMLLAGVCLIWRLWLFRSRRFGEVAAVREIEHSHDELGQLLRTSHQFPDDADHPTPGGTSRALAAVVRQQAREALENTPLDGLVPWRKIRLLCAVLALAVLVFSGLSVFWRDFRVGAGRVFLPAAELTYTGLDVSVERTEFERGEEVIINALVSGREAAEVILEVCLDGTTWEQRGALALQEGVYSIALEDLLQSFDCRVAGGDAVSPPVHVTFVDPPVVEEIQVTVESPPYTGLPPRESSPEKIRAVTGSRVTMEFRLNHALAEGAISQFGGAPVSVTPGSPVIRHVHDVAVGHSRFVMRGKDADDWVLEPVFWNIQGIPDRTPSMEIAVPEEDPEVTRIAEVPVRIVFRDDYGLAEIQLVLTVDGKEKTIARRQFDAPGERRGNLETVVRLEDHDVDVGSSVRLHAVATDFCPEHTARATSDVRMIVIRPFRLIVKPKDPSQLPAEGDPEETKKQLEALKEAIAEQKQVVAETLRRREEEASPERDQKAQDLSQREQQVQEQISQIEPPIQPEEDTAEEQQQTPLQRASEELEQATKALSEPDLQQSLKKEDQALAAMMQAKNELEQKLQQQQQQQQQSSASQKQPQQRPPEPMESLAERARELARQEAQLQERLKELSQPQPENAPQNQEPAQAQQAEQGEQGEKGEQQQGQEKQQAQQGEAQTQQAQKAQEQNNGQQEQASSQSQPSESPAEAMQKLQEKQNQLAGEGRQLRDDLAEHPETTPLANRRMQQAAEMMQEAATQLEQDETEQAANEMQNAEKQLERLAEHLEGLNPEQLAKTLEKARNKTQRAAETVRPEMQQAQAQPQQPQSEQQAQSQPQQSQSEQQAPSQQQQAQSQPQQSQSRQLAQANPQTRQDAAEDARTVDDWMERLAKSEDAGDADLRKRLDKAREDFETEAMADKIAQAESDRMRGNEKQADDTDKETSQQLNELSAQLERERKSAVQAYMQQLAQAEAEAKALQQQLQQNPTDQPGEKGQPSTSERLEQLAEDLDDLNDNKLKDVAQDIRKDIGPFNRRGAKEAGTLIPESVSKTSLPPAVKRLRDLIEEAIQREYLLGRDQRIPEKYDSIVEAYFKALSDDAKQ